jgi:hypothetical protein
MEVHHHSHTSRKKWTHYFWEFLMLFLAVFCGFLAENQREHMVEHSRAKAYAKSLYKDLQSDTADINKAAWCENMVSNTIDSLVDLIGRPDYLQKGGLLYYYMRVASMAYNVDWNKATINQLISSGNLRYFSNQQLVTQISKYNTVANITTNNDDLIENRRARSAAYRDQVLIPRYQQSFSLMTLDDFFYGRKSAVIDSLKNTNVPLQNNTAGLVNAFTNAILDTKVNRLIAKRKHYPRALELATEIMELLKKEYHLK